MNKRFFLITGLFILLLLSAGCFTVPVVETANSFEPGTFKDTYGEEALTDAYFTLFNTWEDTIKIQVDAINANKNASLNARQKALDSLNDMKYLEHGSFSYTISTDSKIDQPLLDLSFKLVDGNGNDYILKTVMIYYRQQFMMGSEIKSTTHTYHWLIRTKEPIKEVNFPENKRPVELIVTFPGGEVSRYTISPQ
jgi:hypothetical protein